jgi:sarcosine oxidase, subunit gamma
VPGVTVDVEFAELAPSSRLNLRIEPREAGRWTDVLGAALPSLPNMVTATPDGWVCWLGPDEWLLTGTFEPSVMEQRLREAADGLAISVVNVSAARVALRIVGPAARDLLAHGCALDLDASVFTAGRCAQTRLALANVLLVAPEDQPDFANEPVFELLVRTSFARYVNAWLVDAATEYLAGR